MAVALLPGNALAAQPPVSLGAVEGFAVLAGTTVTSTGPSVLGGDLGVSPGTAVTGFRPPGTVSGTIHAGDAPASQAQAALTGAYTDAASRTPATAAPADLGGSTLTPGVYRSGSSLGLTGALTLDGRGDPNAVFVFQAASTLTTASASAVNLVNGAQACNVFWQIGSSATLGTTSVFAGNLLAFTSITITTGVAVNGRALARTGAVTLDSDTITAAHCAPPTTGGGGTTGGGTTGGGGVDQACIGSRAPAQSAAAATRARPAGRSDRRSPARPLLRSPGAGAHVRAGFVTFSWHAAARAARYTLMVDRHRMNTGCLTRAAMRVPAGRHRWLVIAVNRYGATSSRPRAFAASGASPSVDEIRRGLGLDVLGKDVVAAAERITLQAAEAGALRASLLALDKIVSKAGVVGFLIGILAGPIAQTACDEDYLLYGKAKPVFAEAGDALARVARAHPGPHPRILAELTNAQTGINTLIAFIASFHPSKDCAPPFAVATNTIKTLQPTLSAAKQRLDKLAASQEPSKTNTKDFKAKCMTAQKLLTKYTSLYPKVNRGKPLDPKTKKKLDDKGETIRFADLPGTLHPKFPGEFKGYDLAKIRKLCK